MSFVKHILVCLLPILLFYNSWPPHTLTGFIFVAFIPVLWSVFNFNTGEKKFPDGYLFASLYLTFFLINFTLTSWVMNAHWGGGLFASLFNASLMSSVFFLVYKLRKSYGNKHALIAFPLFWLAFEYLHLNWELTWPWLTLGNVFSNQTDWIQWYEYTGVLGGSFWVLIINALLYLFTAELLKKQYRFGALIVATIVFIIPYVLSKQLTPLLSNPKVNPVQVVVVQPNYEPHFEKFSTPQSAQFERVEILLDSVWESNADLIVLPETFITDWIWESRIENAPAIKYMKSWLKNHPNTQILTGASTGKVLSDSDSLKTTARISVGGTWYEVFNTALLISPDDPVQIFHKSKLVPGAEMTPYSSLLKPLLDRFPIELGGAVGNFGVNESIFNLSSHQGLLTPMICYESIFGEYVSKFVGKGAGWICIITNDGWWGDTFGHQQHQAYARLRAVETRRYVVRSANTGISSIIRPDGHVEQFLSYDEAGILEATISQSHLHTFYVRHGDYIGRLASFLAIVYLLQLIMHHLNNLGSNAATRLKK